MNSRYCAAVWNPSRSGRIKKNMVVSELVNSRARVYGKKNRIGNLSEAVDTLLLTCAGLYERKGPELLRCPARSDDSFGLPSRGTVLGKPVLKWNNSMWCCKSQLER